MTKEEMEKQIHDFAELVYKTGCEDGYSRGYDEGVKDGQKGKISEMLVDTYTQGLNDAWECARKISLNGENGGIPYKEFTKIFCDISSPYDVFRKYTITEVIAKIKEYEEKQKPKFANCSILNDECAYPYITCDKCEVHCSIARARQKLKGDKE